MKTASFQANACTTALTALTALVAMYAPSQPVKAQSLQPSLYCYVVPNDQPAPPNFGRCTSFFPSSSYVASFSVRNLPPGNYSYVWTSDLGLVLACTTSTCSQTYRGDMGQVSDFVHVTYTDLATGISKTLSRAVAINGPL